VLKSVIYKVAFSSIAAVLAVCQPASAQLNIGRYGIQPGLEENYLQYQLSGEPLSQMRVIPGCITGFGLGCNKSGEVLQELLESNNRSSYSDLLMRAAGGEQNFRNFSSFYGNNPRLPEVPYSSFWHDDAKNIMDGSQYVLGQPVGRVPVDGLGAITKNFYWSPYSGDNNSLSLRDGLLNLKMSYGRLALQEAAKIPNIQQQIQSLGLPKEMTQYYLGNISRGFQALNSGNENSLKNSIFNLLSMPYSPNGGEFGRPLAGIGNEFNLVYGQGLEASSFVGSPLVTLEPESIDIETTAFESGSVLNPSGSDNGFPYWIFGLALLGLLFFLLSGGSGNSSSPGGTALANAGQIPGVTPPPPSPSPTVCADMPSGNGVVNNNQNTNTSCTPPTPVPPEVKKVPEPSTVIAVLLMTIVFLLYQKQRRSLVGWR
jgi:hypothetical protein